MFINVGILLSYVSNYTFSGLPVHLGWRAMYGIGVIPPMFIAGGGGARVHVYVVFSASQLR